MPMNFPDLNSLIRTARIHKFREIEANESEDHFRNSLSDHVRNIDPIESQEIKFKVGWDQWTDEQKQSLFQ